MLEWTEANFGALARERYASLILAALQDLAADPERPGSRARPELGSDIRSYHLRSSRGRMSRPSERVQRPRHFVLYRKDGVAALVIGRILHEAMDAERHVGDW